MSNKTFQPTPRSLDDVTIRPIKKEDLALERKFYNHLSAQTKHYRFLGGVNQLTDTELKALCDIDFEHHMAFIATVTINGEERGAGVSRYAIDDTGEAFEFAITVADEWQHKGLGTLLMKKLIAFAQAHNVKKLYSTDLADNYHMQELADDLGMKCKRDPADIHQVIYTLLL